MQSVGLAAMAVALLAVAAARPAAAQNTPKDRATASAAGDLEARRLLDRAQELLDMGERERGVKMIETVLEQYPSSRMIYPACLALGKHYIHINQQPQAISYLNRLRVLDPAETPAQGEDRELLLEAMYLTGVAYFQTRQYGQAFPVLRHITVKYPNTVWANQAYYHIGLCHFAQQNWNKAIEALGLVGTFIDPASPTTEFAEAGRRFYVKVEDPDFPVMLALGKKIAVTVETPDGDKEVIECIPLTPDAQILIGSIPTVIGKAKAGDRILQVGGGQKVTATYVDEMTLDGASNIVRSAQVRIVSTGMVDFMLGDFEGRAAAAFLAQPLFIQLLDVDLDTSDAAESVTLTVISRYKMRPEDEDEDQSAFADESSLRYETRDRVEVKLTEQGNAPVRTGRFTGKVDLVQAQENQVADQSDNLLACLVGDEVVITYTDLLHIGGEAPRAIDAKIVVAGEIDNRPRATQDVVFDPVLRARKNLVEATAYLELARIFRSMGLMKGTREKAVEGVARADLVIRSSNREVPDEVKQQAYKLKWELHIEADQLSEAMVVCGLFSQRYPNSPLATEALMSIGKIRLEEKQYAEAIQIFRQITALRNSESGAEAQFRIAETMEQINKAASRGGSAQMSSSHIGEYANCARLYPSSPFAGESMAKLIDYNISQGDISQANSLLEQTFQDYPDASFLDSMLMKWVLVAYQAGDFAKAKEKCTKLIFEYPESRHAETARQVLPRIEARLQ